MSEETYEPATQTDTLDSGEVVVESPPPPSETITEKISKPASKWPWLIPLIGAIALLALRRRK